MNQPRLLKQTHILCTPLTWHSFCCGCRCFCCDHTTHPLLFFLCSFLLLVLVSLALNFNSNHRLMCETYCYFNSSFWCFAKQRHHIYLLHQSCASSAAATAAVVTVLVRIYNNNITTAATTTFISTNRTNANISK